MGTHEVHVHQRPLYVTADSLFTWRCWGKRHYNLRKVTAVSVLHTRPVVLTLNKPELEVHDPTQQCVKPTQLIGGYNLGWFRRKTDSRPRPLSQTGDTLDHSVRLSFETSFRLLR